MTPPRQTLNQSEGPCAAHGQFEARIDEKFDAIKAGVDALAEEAKETRAELKAISESLSDGRVEFKDQDGRLKALEKNSNDCAIDRERMKTKIEFLSRGYWLAVGALVISQLLLQVALKLWK